MFEEFERHLESLCEHHDLAHITLTFNPLAERTKFTVYAVWEKGARGYMSIGCGETFSAAASEAIRKSHETRSAIWGSVKKEIVA